MRRLVAIAMLSALFITAGAASPAFACGCGVVVGPQDQQVAASNERAIVHWDGTKETIDLQLDLESESLAAGMIIPTPLPALVSEGDARLFDLAEGMAAPTDRVETDWWGLGYLRPDPEPQEVVVLDRVTVAGVESSHLTALLASSGSEFRVDQYYPTNAGQTFVVTFTFNDDVAEADRTALAQSVFSTWEWTA